MTPSGPNGLMANVSRSCPDSEQLAAYADGFLEEPERQSITEHLADCAECRMVWAETMAFLATESGTAPAPEVRPFPFRQWALGAGAALAAAAAIVAIRVVMPTRIGMDVSGPEIQELAAALSHEPTRPTEGRLTGEFAYGPPPTATRGPAAQ